MTALASQQSCGKRRYATGSQARAAVDAIRKRGYRDSRPDRIPVRAYPCPRCHGWHLTGNAR